MEERVNELWTLFQKYKGTPLEYSHVISKITIDDNEYPILWGQTLTLGEAILLQTRNLQSIFYLIGTGIDFANMAHIVLFEWMQDAPDRLYDFLVALAIPPDQLSDPDTPGWAPDTAVKCAIHGTHYRWLRILLEYGCQLPRRLISPAWANNVALEVEARKIYCRNAVIQVLGIARFRRRAERDTLRMVARCLKMTWRDDKWLI